MKNYDSNLIQLLALLSRIQLTAVEKKLIKNLIDKIANWEDFFELAKLNRHAPFVYKTLKTIGLNELIPSSVQNKFEKTIKEVEKANSLRLDEARKFIQEFSKNNIPVIILKGIYFAQDFYHDPNYKRMNDVDILIHLNDLDKIFNVYESLSYFSAGELLGKDAKDHDEFSHHLPPFFSRNLNLMIGTHWELHTPMRSYRLDYKAIWNRAVEFNFLGSAVMAMSEVDNLHHLCVHLSYFKAGARELADLSNLIRAKRENFRWSIFIEEVHKAKSYDPVYLAMAMTNTLDPMTEISFVLEKIRPYVKKTTIIKATAKNNLSVLLTTRSGHITQVDKAFTSFKSTKKPTEKLKFYIEMWKHLLNPPLIESYRICNETHLSFINTCKVRILSPFKIMSSLCDDLGTKIFFLLLFYTFYKTISAFILNPLNSNIEDQSSFAKKLGVTVADLKSLQDRLE